MEATVACSCFILACLSALALQVFFSSPISPDLLQLPPSPLLPSNGKLQQVIKLGEGILRKPEDLAIDKNGMLYAATRDGWIKRRHKNGSWENWKHIDSDALLGITITAAGDIVACDSNEGLLKVNEDGVAVIASHMNGTKISFADDVIEASDGSLYFSVASTKFGFHNWYLDVLEAKPHGQLLKYDPRLNETSVLLDGLGFANGVALSAAQDFLIVCESWRFRCLKYWLKEEMEGRTEVFIDNLPGAPDNINLAPDGSYWIALVEVSASKYKFVHKSKALKHLAATFPGLIDRINGARTKAMVVKVTGDGKIIELYDDPTGGVMSFVTSALEFEDHLYLGSLNCDFVGKISLTTEYA